MELIVSGIQIISPWLNLLLILLIFISLTKIKNLRLQLAEEKKKRQFPLLLIEFDPDDGQTYLFNDSFCLAKDITIEDFDLNIDVGFKKILKIKCAPIEIIKPEQKAALVYKIFDGKYDRTKKSAPFHLNSYVDDGLEIHLTYRNNDNIAFTSTFTYAGEKFIVKEAKIQE